MTGIADYNRPAFAEAAAILRGAGLEVFNPGELNEAIIQPFTWEKCMKKCISELVWQDGLVLLPKWETSRGARLEFHIASEIGMLTFDWDLFMRHLKKAASEGLGRSTPDFTI